MTRTDLVQLATRLTQSPVPTLQKKVYGYQGHITPLLEALPPAITIDTWVTTACHSAPLPTQVERIPAYLGECLTAHIQHLQTSRATSIVVLREAVLLARYRVPLAFFYDLTGDAHAIILHLATGSRPKGWTLPSYVHYDLEAPATYLTQALGDQFIRDDQGEGAPLNWRPSADAVAGEEARP
jgi:hypothetical protein